MFTQSYIDFFKELSENNNSDWFNSHKKTYEIDVKKPFEAFIKAIIDDIHKITPEIMIDPKDAIFRINKDVRFSADKSPYKTEMSAAISKNGKKSNPCPGLYLSLGFEKVIIASGIKFVEKENLNEIRHHIAQNLEEFNSIISSKEFVTTFRSIQGDKIKRLPEELRAAAEEQPLIYNTNFLVTVELPATAMLNPNFKDEIIQIYKHSLPLSNFLSEVID